MFFFVYVCMKLVSVLPSTRAEKKYVAVFEKPGGARVTTHFGARGMGDYLIYTRTGGKGVAQRHRAAYRSRHARDDLKDPTSAGALSWYLLWGDHPTLRGNLRSFKRRFRV